jgi:hypothetical protein
MFYKIKIKFQEAAEGKALFSGHARSLLTQKSFKLSTD